MTTFGESGWTFGEPGRTFGGGGITLAYEDDLGRVRITGTGLDGWESVLVERSVDGIRWETIRGGTALPVTGGVFTLDDYEFPAGELTYRVSGFDADDDPTGVLTDTVAPELAQVWLKSIARPFLNRPVTVTGVGDVSRPARGGILEGMGRRDPVAVTEVRGSRRFDLTVRAADADETAALALVLSFGDTVYLHVPDGCIVPASGHFHVGDVTERRPPRHDSHARYFDLPLTEVEAPAAVIVGYTATCAGILAAFATCAEVLAEFDTCLDLLQYVSDPTDETVG